MCTNRENVKVKENVEGRREGTGMESCDKNPNAVLCLDCCRVTNCKTSRYDAISITLIGSQLILASSIPVATSMQ